MPAKQVKVFVRIRPNMDIESDSIVRLPEPKSIEIQAKKEEDGGYINNLQNTWKFSYDGILNNATQESVYSEVADPIVADLFEGYNGTIMAYGQTSAGKTFTMTGWTDKYEHRGVIPRAINQVFRRIAEKSDTMMFNVRISYLEIYNENIVDLLSATSAAGGSSNNKQTAPVVEDGDSGSFVRGLNVLDAGNEAEALDYFFEGEVNRTLAVHQLNKYSTRSHCIFTVHLEMRSRIESSEKVTFAKLNLVDLAGSERISKTHSSGNTLREAGYINKSLTFLEQVVLALSDKKRDHIPYRQSKLTNVLRDALGGNCNTALIANIRGERQHLEETISTLRFATRVLCVQTNPRTNIQYDPVALLKKQEVEIMKLKQELAMHDTLVNRKNISYEPFTEAQKVELRRQIKSYLDDEIEELEIINVRQIKEIYSQFKFIFKSYISGNPLQKAPSFMRNLNSNGAEGRTGGDKSTDDGDRKDQSKNDHGYDDGVGETDGDGMAIGRAPGKGGRNISSAATRFKKKQTFHQPAANVDNANTGANNSANLQNRNSIADNELMKSLANLGTKGDYGGDSSGDRPAPPPMAKEYQAFKASKGAELSKKLQEQKDVLREKRRNAKELSDRLLECKSNIESIAKKLEKNKESSAEALHVTASKALQSEANALVDELSKKRNEYKDIYDEMKRLKTEIDYAGRLVDQARRRLAAEFELWYRNAYGANLDRNVQVSQLDLFNGSSPEPKRSSISTGLRAPEDLDANEFYEAKRRIDKRLQRSLHR